MLIMMILYPSILFLVSWVVFGMYNGLEGGRLYGCGVAAAFSIIGTFITYLWRKHLEKKYQLGEKTSKAANAWRRTQTFSLQGCRLLGMMEAAHLITKEHQLCSAFQLGSWFGLVYVFSFLLLL